MSVGGAQSNGDYRGKQPRAFRPLAADGARLHAGVSGPGLASRPALLHRSGARSPFPTIMPCLGPIRTACSPTAPGGCTARTSSRAWRRATRGASLTTAAGSPSSCRAGKSARLMKYIYKPFWYRGTVTVTPAYLAAHKGPLYLIVASLTEAGGPKAPDHVWFNGVDLGALTGPGGWGISGTKDVTGLVHAGVNHISYKPVRASMAGTFFLSTQTDGEVPAHGLRAERPDGGLERLPDGDGDGAGAGHPPDHPRDRPGPPDQEHGLGRQERLLPHAGRLRGLRAQHGG